MAICCFVFIAIVNNTTISNKVESLEADLSLGRLWCADEEYNTEILVQLIEMKDFQLSDFEDLPDSLNFRICMDTLTNTYFAEINRYVFQFDENNKFTEITPGYDSPQFFEDMLCIFPWFWEPLHRYFWEHPLEHLEDFFGDGHDKTCASSIHGTHE